MTEEGYKFFQNRKCEFFPCHTGVAEEEFSCLFCFCPLYALGSGCGGKCTFNDAGNKVCSDCGFPHVRENYEKIVARYGEIMDVIRKNEDK